jgi:hypothetical protein
MGSETLASLISLFFANLGERETRYTQSLAYTQAILELDEEDDSGEAETYLPALKKEIENIRDNTTKKLKIPLAICEHVFIRDKAIKNLGMTIDVYGHEVQLFDIIYGLAEAFARLITIVSTIALKNNVGVTFDLSQYKIGKEEEMKAKQMSQMGFDVPRRK